MGSSRRRKNLTLLPRKASDTFTRAQKSKLATVKMAYMMFLPQDEGLGIYVKENIEHGKHYFMYPLLGL